jgi:hypothetical protein
MVPVPTEHVPEVMQFVLRLISDQEQGQVVQAWDQEAANRLFLEADEPARSVLALLAEPGNAGRPVPQAEVADVLELRPHDIGGIVGPLNTLSKEVYGRVPPIMSTDHNGQPAGGRQLQRRFFLLTPALAEMFRSAETATLELEGDRSPITGT